jgi:hypothetical protein
MYLKIFGQNRCKKFKVLCTKQFMKVKICVKMRKRKSLNFPQKPLAYPLSQFPSPAISYNPNASCSLRWCSAQA